MILGILMLAEGVKDFAEDEGVGCDT